MIVVGLHRTYPVVIDDVKNGQLNNAWTIAAALSETTLGNWPKLSVSSLQGYLDYIVGTSKDMIVTAYKTSGFELVELDGVEKIRFVAESIYTRLEDDKDELFGAGTFGSLRTRDTAAWLIGCPIPGGPWKRGESRGTRRYLLSDYLQDHPEMEERQKDEFSERNAELLCKFFAGSASIDEMDFPQLNPDSEKTGRTATEDGVTVVRHPGGTVVVTIPTGVRAQINIEPTS